MNKYYFHNMNHIGDCLISLHLLKKISINNNINCELLIDKNYIGQNIESLKEFISDCNLVKIQTEKYEFPSINMHYDPIAYEAAKINQTNKLIYYPQIEFVFDLWMMTGNFICNKLGFNNCFNELNDVIFDSDIFKNDKNYKEYDFLIVNSYTRSGQVNFSDIEQDNYFYYLCEYLKKQGKKIITTKKIEGFESTQDYNMSLIDIGQLSKKCKNILGVPTSPFLISINKYSMDKCEKFISLVHRNIIFDINNKFHNIKLENIDFLINNFLKFL